MKSTIPKFILISFSLFLLSACERNTKTKIKKDYSYEYVDLNNKEIDSIYNSHLKEIVFLSFYPGMHRDIYMKQSRIELDKKNLIRQFYSHKDGIDYIFKLDNYNAGSFSVNEISLIVSMEKLSIDLISYGYIRESQYNMAINLYKEKYGKPKDTVLKNKHIFIFEDKHFDKLITFYYKRSPPKHDDDSNLYIKYYTKKTFKEYLLELDNKKLRKIRSQERVKEEKKQKQKEMLKKI